MSDDKSNRDSGRERIRDERERKEQFLQRALERVFE